MLFYLMNSKCLSSPVVKGVVYQIIIFVAKQVLIPLVHFLALNSIFKLQNFSLGSNPDFFTSSVFFVNSISKDILVATAIC